MALANAENPLAILVVENDYLEKLTEDSNEGLAAIAYASGRT